MRIYLLPFYALLTLALAGPALATDGVLEINQTCAVQTGCFAGDAAGFPVVIGSPGSDLLTSDLAAGNNERGIEISVSGVTLDLNGFRIVSARSNSTSVNGITGPGLENAEIRNGTVQGFGGRGIIFGGASRAVRIIDIRTLGNGGRGVDLDGQGHLVSRSTSSDHGLCASSVCALPCIASPVVSSVGSMDGFHRLGNETWETS